jgi:hypothetical protein
VFNKNGFSCTGAHRYVLLAYKQLARIAPMRNGRSAFRIAQFARQYNLTDPPTAGNYFLSEIKS